MATIEMNPAALIASLVARGHAIGECESHLLALFPASSVTRVPRELNADAYKLANR
jgi:hypothetical protein